MAAGASRLAGGRNLRIEEEFAAEVDQRLIFNGRYRRAPIFRFHASDVSLRGDRRGKPSQQQCAQQRRG
jgi:hypothetical protein